jgi:hypothetical protein
MALMCAAGESHRRVALGTPLKWEFSTRDRVIAGASRHSAQTLDSCDMTAHESDEDLGFSGPGRQRWRPITTPLARPTKN